MKFAMTKEFMKATLCEPTYNFVLSQLKNQKRHLQGRRFSLDDKIFALTLLKQSPKGYSLLKKIFALPSRKTLMAVLNRVTFNVGVNNHIMKCLGKVLEKKPKSDSYCYLLFDEMALEPGLAYDQRTDAIEGFENCGDGQRRKYADHAMVFMIRGVFRKWKQPIAYFFTEHGMSTADITRNIKEIVTACQHIGLHIVGTICDQMSTNVKAIENLKQDSKARALRIGKEFRLTGFEINGEEIIPLYDPPHLIKGLRNNLLEHDVSFQWKDFKGTASWKDIKLMYEADDGDYDTKMLNHLTSAHIYPDKMNKMKVKLAAQILSRRVSSTIRGMARLGDIIYFGATINSFLLFFYWQLQEPFPQQPMEHRNFSFLRTNYSILLMAPKYVRRKERYCGAQ